METIKKENLEVALEVIKAVKKTAKAQNLPAPGVDQTLTIALRFTESGPVPIAELAPKIVEVWKAYVEAIWKQALRTAEEIAPLRFAQHSDRYSDAEKAEAQAFADELVERNNEALSRLAKL